MKIYTSSLYHINVTAAKNEPLLFNTSDEHPGEAPGDFRLPEWNCGDKSGHLFRRIGGVKRTQSPACAFELPWSEEIKNTRHCIHRSRRVAPEIHYQKTAAGPQYALNLAENSRGIFPVMQRGAADDEVHA